MLSSLDKLVLHAFSRNNRETRRILRRAELPDDPPRPRRARRDYWRVEIAVFWLRGIHTSATYYVVFPVFAALCYLYALAALLHRLVM
jgi:hypothetical protein